MALNNISSFFDWKKFSADKDFEVSSVKPWWSYKKNEKTGKNEKDEIIGTNVQVGIVRDDTVYPQKDGEQVTNLFNQMTFHVREINYPVELHQHVVPVDPTVKIYGEYNNNLTITCDQLRVVGNQTPTQSTSPMPPAPMPKPAQQTARKSL